VELFESDSFMPPILNQSELAIQLRAWAQALGFRSIAAADVNLIHAEPGLQAWLEAGYHGEMGYMKEHGLKRARPPELVPGTISVLTLQMPYLPQSSPEQWIEKAQGEQKQPGMGVISLYARGRDYHKVVRRRLQRLVDHMQAYWLAHGPADAEPFAARVFTDSAPVLEVELGQQNPRSWRGKHTLLLSRTGGSMVFLGEIFTNLPLALFAGLDDFVGEAASQSGLEDRAEHGGHCGTCERCLTVCPTQAIVAPYRLDARRCISYLTIEHPGSLPVELRRAMGNRIYGCDDCQLACPWNKFAQKSALPDFDAREALVPHSLAWQMRWTQDDFLQYTEGSPLRRIGHERWQRNVAVACGNALAEPTLPHSEREAILQALGATRQTCSDMVGEHIDWALNQAI
jgi:epoxyqueuosine reductase